MVRQGKYTRVSPVRRAKRATKRHWRWWRELSKKQKILLIAVPILLFLVLTPLATYLYFYNDIADQERLMNRNNTGVVLVDRNGEKFFSFGSAEHRDVVPLGEMSDNVKNALVASEDKDFYKHGGFSIEGIMRAVYGTVTSQEAYGGGSTLTQQLAKNTLLSSERSFLRKYQELAVSVAIEQRYSKDQILEMYLNSVFFGGTTFGIQDAAKVYFNKSPKDLTLAESAMLVGILPSPNAYSPTIGNPEFAKERQTTVLGRMVTNGYITEGQKQAALAEQLAYAPAEASSEGEAPHFAEMVLEELYKKYGEEKTLRSGYQVQTTLDLNLQRKLKANVADNMRFIQRNGGSNAAGIAIDPTSGEVRALVGSSDWNNPEWGKVNLATTARQPGSSFKPIYFSEALAEGVITPATILADLPTDFGGGYAPKNANGNFNGDISVRNALARSLNIPAVKVMQKLGIEKSVETAQRMGISTVSQDKNYGLSLALGSAEASLIQMTNAYAAFANQGQQYPTTIIQKIENKYDELIFRSDEKSKQVISPEGAFLISSILSDNNARAPIFGSSLTVSGRTAAVKTGTTDEQRDAWTIGYTPQLAIGVWVGNNNNQKMLNGGSGMAGPIWVKTMRQALEGVADTPFPIAGGVVQKAVCFNGGLANASGTNTYNEYFLASTLPSTQCTATQKEPEKPAEKPKEEEPTEEGEPSEDDSSGTPPNNGSGNGQSNGNNGNGSGTNPGTGGGITLPTP